MGDSSILQTLLFYLLQAKEKYYATYMTLKAMLL